VPGFRPWKLEWGFGPRGDGVEVVVGPPGWPVRLNGSVDRIDAAADGRAVVLDWKWSRKDRFHGVEDEIDEGADLQLPVYALAVTRGLGRRVVAVGYVTLRDQHVRWLPLTGDAPAAVQGRAPEGWAEGDGSAALTRAEDHIVRLDRAIRGGRVCVDPRDEDLCTWCPYADLCRYERIPGRQAEGAHRDTGGKP
jgi:RecB family exonuclease